MRSADSGIVRLDMRSAPRPAAKRVAHRTEPSTPRRVRLAVLGLALVVSGALAGVPSPAFALSTTPDDTWMTNGPVFAMARSGNVLYLGGKFTKLRENPPGQGGRRIDVANLAAINLTTGEPIESWTPAVSGTAYPPIVRALAVAPDGSRVYVGGRFDAIDGALRRNLGAVDAATGNVIGGFAPQAGYEKNWVHAILAVGDRVYIGGAFSNVQGKFRKKLAALATDGTLDVAWKPKPNRVVRTMVLASDGQTMFVGGAFSSVGGVPRQAVARLTLDTGELHPWAIPSGTIGDPQTAWSLVATPSRLFGGFGRGPNYAAAFRLDNGNSGNQVWRFGTVGNVQTVAPAADGSRLFIGGHFGTARLQQRVCGDKYLHGLASLNPGTGVLDCGWLPVVGDPTKDNYNGPWSMAPTGSALWVGGKWPQVAGIARKHLARFTL